MGVNKIFVVEDESNIQQLIKYNLESDGYDVILFEKGEKLLEKINSEIPDMFILDLMLPGIDGFEVCRRIKENPKTKNIPIIILTAKSDEFDKLHGLELGADDYITKPFSVKELIARVKALFRRANIKEDVNEVILKYQDIIIDLKRHEVKKNGLIIELSHKEFKLLEALVNNKGQVLSRELLLDKVWGYEYFGETRTVDVHIRFLRKKIEDDDSKPKYIETIRGVGYKLKDNI